MCSFSVKTRRKPEKTRENILSFLRLDRLRRVATAPLKSLAAYTHGQRVHNKLTNKSARFTQVVL